MGIFQNHLMAAAVAKAAESTDFYDHQIANSVRLEGATPNYFGRTPGSAGNNKTFTFSIWLKRTVLDGAVQTILDATDGSGEDSLFFNTSNQLETYSNAGAGTIKTNAVFRDISAWMHIVWRYDTTQAVDTNRERLYVNGELQTLASSTYPAQNATAGLINDSCEHDMGRAEWSDRYPFHGYFAEIVMIDGTSLAPTSFGESKNGVWIPIDVSGLTFGTNGFYLNMASSGDLGNDVSGNNNDWASNGFAATDQMLDTPTFDGTSNGGNFSTLLGKLLRSYGRTYTMSEGNLQYAGGESGETSNQYSTMGASSGKWYAEFLVETVGNNSAIGIASSEAVSYDNSIPYTNGNSPGGMGYLQNGNVRFNNTDTSSGYDTYDTGDIIQVAMDIDNTKVWFGKNNTWQNSGDPAAGTNASYTDWTTQGTFSTWHFATAIGGTSGVHICNFGQEGTFAGNETAGDNADGSGYGNFLYAPPSGFLALCTGNLPTPAADPAADDGPGKYFNAVTYTGTGSSAGITGVGFQPDTVLIKNRGETDNWCHQNDVLGVAKTQAWNDDAAVADETDCIDSFDSDGFTVDTDDKVNASSETYVAYCWKESADAGFDIYTYSGTGSAVTVSHSLGVAPDLILNFLNTGSAWDSTSYWNTASMGTGEGIFMPLTNAAQSTTYVDSTSTSNFVTTNMSTSGRTYFGYAIANKEGLVKVGEYEGNGNADGSFVYCGFRPAWIMIKRIDSTGNWHVFNNKVPAGYNTITSMLWANTTGAEDTASSNAVDFLSNGFKIYTAAAEMNTSGGDYVYLAIAKNPLKYATAR